MVRIETWLDCEINAPVKVQYLSGNLFSQDNGGNLIGVNVLDNGVGVSSLSGTVSANVIRSDGGTVAVTGTLAAHQAHIVLPQAAYAVPGPVTIVIKLTDGGVVTTLAAIVTVVYQSSTDATVDPGTIIPSIQTLINQINAAVASIPADYSSLWAALAPAYTQQAYSVGQYRTYEGGLYRCTTPIESGETWNSSHWTSVSLGNDLTDLNAAFIYDRDGMKYVIPNGERKILSCANYKMWYESNPQLNMIYYPLTITKEVFISALHFYGSFTSECTATFRITSKDRNTIYAENKYIISQSGNQEVYINLPTALFPGEYKITVSVDSGYIKYTTDSGSSSNEYMNTTGTDYFYSNSNIKYTGEIEYVTQGSHAALVLDKIASTIPRQNYKTPYSEFNMTNVNLTKFYVPITIQNENVYVESVEFVASFTSACTLTVSVVSKDEQRSFGSKQIEIPISGKHIINADVPSFLSSGEYRIYFAISAGYISYPFYLDSYYNDGYIENKGTVYFYNNPGIVFAGELHYLVCADITLDDFVQKDIFSRDFHIVNPSVLLSEPTNAGGWTITKKELVCNYTASSGNGWALLPVDVINLENGFVRFEGNINLGTGSEFKTFIQGKHSVSGNNIYILISEITTSGKFGETVDLNHLAVYNNLDLSQPVYYLIANKTSPCMGSVINYSLTTPVSTFDSSKSFLENLSQMRKDVDTNTSAISGFDNGNFLVSPDGSKYYLAVTNSGVLNVIPAVPDKMLFIGNSLLFGNGRFGMCASAIDKDYYHYVTQAILTKKTSATFNKLLGTDFEGCTSIADAESWMENTLLSYLGNDIDLVLVQLGDNVNTTEKLTAFQQTCAKLVKYIKENAPAARVAWAGEWYSSQAKQTIIQNACEDNGAVFIDLTPLQSPANNSHIGAVVDYGVSSTRYYTVDSYTDDSANHKLTITMTINGVQYTSIVVPYSSYSADESSLAITGTCGIVTNSGVASHPGDSGMLAIGNLIIEKLGLN